MTGGCGVCRVWGLLAVLAVWGCSDASTPSNGTDTPDQGGADMRPVVDMTAPADMRAPQDMPPEMGRDMAPDMASDMDVLGRLGHCAEVEQFGPVFPGIVERFRWQDEQSGGPTTPPLVFVGSSSIRRWEHLTWSYTDYNPIQRGFGGAQLGEVALYADRLIIRHNPRAVVVFAGTNDVAAGVSPPVVVERFRCLRERVGVALGWSVPVIFIGITPTPARWDHWEASSEVNEGVKALAAVDKGILYADVPSLFLMSGAPPSDRLFVEDRLHLSLEGYALWDRAVRQAVERAVQQSPKATTPQRPLSTGDRVLVDLGPNNPEDGKHTPSPDVYGQHWNNWHGAEGGEAVLPGEHLNGLRTAENAQTDIDLVISGGFRSNGFATGGLMMPDRGKLGDLALFEATGDFFYSEGADQPGGLHFRGLDPAKTYTLRFFAARAHGERRVTRYVVLGGVTKEVSLQTSGAGAGADGADVNDDTIAEMKGVRPNDWGYVFIDVQAEEGPYGYLSAVELVAE